LIGKFCPHPKFTRKEKGVGKKNFVFFLLCLKRGGGQCFIDYLDGKLPAYIIL
jgi:hypothetical protein